MIKSVALSIVLLVSPGMLGSSLSPASNDAVTARVEVNRTMKSDRLGQRLVATPVKTVAIRPGAAAVAEADRPLAGCETLVSQLADVEVSYRARLCVS